VNMLASTPNEVSEQPACTAGRRGWAQGHRSATSGNEPCRDQVNVNTLS
jgi:hypothetical protein